MIEIRHRITGKVIHYVDADTLEGIDLLGVDLREAGLWLSNLSGANLRYANLSHADLSHANLRDADLRGSALFHANLGAADLEGAELEGATYDHATQWPEEFDPQELGARLGAEAAAKDARPEPTAPRAGGQRLEIMHKTTGGVLLEVDSDSLEGLDLEGVDLSYAFLPDARMRGVSLKGASLFQANLRGADLSDADLQDAILGGADLTESDLSGADLARANLEGPSEDPGRVGYGFLLCGVVAVVIAQGPARGMGPWLIIGALLAFIVVFFKRMGDGTRLARANLRGTNLEQANLTGVSLRGARYDGTTRWPDGFNPQRRGAIQEGSPAG